MAVIKRNCDAAKDGLSVSGGDLGIHCPLTLVKQKKLKLVTQQRSDLLNAVWKYPFMLTDPVAQ